MNPDTLRKAAHELAGFHKNKGSDFVYVSDVVDLRAAADAWEAVEEELRLTTEMETKLNDECVELRQRLEEMRTRSAKILSDAADENIALRQRLEAARWLIEQAPHCYGSMAREWETRRSAWQAALAAGDTISDGYQTWDKRCAMCGQDTMQVVRPGKVQCSECG